MGSINKNNTCELQPEAANKLHPVFSMMSIVKKFNEQDTNLTQCFICHLKFLKRSFLITHIREIHVNCPEKKYKCDDCPAQYSTKKDLIRHLYRKNHTAKEFYAYDEDIKRFAEKDKKDTSCSHCSLKFIKREHLSTHIREIHINDEPKKKFKCDYCPAQYSRKRSLIKHMHKNNGQKHKSSVTQIFTNFKKSDKSCSYCSLTFLKREYLITHLREIHLNEDQLRGIKCEKCPFVTKKWKNFRRHLFRNHQIKTILSENGSGINLGCKVCGKFFTESSDRADHMKNEHKEFFSKAYKCDVCDFKTQRYNNYKIHMESPRHSKQVELMKGYENHLKNVTLVSSNLLIERFQENLESIQISEKGFEKFSKIISEAFETIASTNDMKKRLLLTHSLQKEVLSCS